MHIYILFACMILNIIFVLWLDIHIRDKNTLPFWNARASVKAAYRACYMGLKKARMKIDFISWLFERRTIYPG